MSNPSLTYMALQQEHAAMPLVNLIQISYEKIKISTHHFVLIFISFMLFYKKQPDIPLKQREHYMLLTRQAKAL
jgi:hypothetical protein